MEFSWLQTFGARWIMNTYAWDGNFKVLCSSDGDGRVRIWWTWWDVWMLTLKQSFTPQKSNIDAKIAILKGSCLFQTVILGIHVSFRESMSSKMRFWKVTKTTLNLWAKGWDKLKYVETLTSKVLIGMDTWQTPSKPMKRWWKLKRWRLTIQDPNKSDEAHAFKPWIIIIICNISNRAFHHTKNCWVGFPNFFPFPGHIWVYAHYVKQSCSFV